MKKDVKGSPAGRVVTRFAPSPTGYFHAGSYRTALFSCIYARQHGGSFILRIEDTDKERSKKEYEKNIVDSLEWMGLSYDAFYRQSERTEIYRRYIQRLIDSGHAYVSKEAGGKEGGREEVIRFRNPGRTVAFDDLIRGHIEFDTAELGDFVIAKSMDEPVFHLVVVVDDREMGITHIIRGEDHISNTPRQILIYEALGATPPAYAHIPLLLAADRSKLSKRNGAKPVTAYRDEGYLPEAVVNYMALLGWHPADDREVVPFGDIVKEFSLERVQKSGAIFDEEKLAWFNRQYLQRLDDGAFLAGARPFMPASIAEDAAVRLVPLLREKARCYADAARLLAPGGELGFAAALPAYDPEMLLWKKAPDKAAAAAHLAAVKAALEAVPAAGFSADAVKAAVWPYAEAKGRGDVLWPFRIALTGQERSPDPFASAAVLGKEETMARIRAAIAQLG
ncbi:MAG: glutamate--tRNA ligase [Patescibacteria group bacterium]|nr:glutamate--tRNA ligase [Patescibacteria group bacterium]